MIKKRLQFLIGIMLLNTVPIAAQEIVQDAEYYVLKAQHGEKWVAEDKDLDKKLDALRKKYGTPPNN